MTGAVPPSSRRWAVSFADLSLLIACILFVGWRPEADNLTRAQPNAGVILRVPIDRVFADGEAFLSVAGAAQVRRIVAGHPEPQAVSISVGTAATASRRLDHWELAAARTAAIARQLRPRQQVRLGAPHDGRDIRITLLP